MNTPEDKIPDICMDDVTDFSQLSDEDRKWATEQAREAMLKRRYIGNSKEKVHQTEHTEAEVNGYSEKHEEKKIATLDEFRVILNDIAKKYGQEF